MPRAQVGTEGWRRSNRRMARWARGAARHWTSRYRFRHAVERAGSGSGRSARCRAADCGWVPGVIVARALSATGEAITLVGFAEAAGGGKGGEALVEGG